jgi:hypothetical protein
LQFHSLEASINDFQAIEKAFSPRKEHTGLMSTYFGNWDMFDLYIGLINWYIRIKVLPTQYRYNARTIWNWEVISPKGLLTNNDKE